ncbi:MAG: phage DNA encapsidation protein [Cetobacterium sp.]
MKKELQPKYYNPKNILNKKAIYNMIMGERSNGKTYSILKYCIQECIKNKSTFAILRRWKEDITGRRATSIFTAINDNNEISKITNGEFDRITYYAGKFYLGVYDSESGKVIYNDKDLIAYAFAISEGEHLKSTAYPTITNILFDEFITNKVYLQDEFIHFMNIISTIIRQRTNVKIFMLGNTVNKFCPYFQEMGLINIPTMKQGTIDVYKYGESDLKVAVEYCESIKDSKQNNHYFAFDNPKLNMITGGAWELNLYPHLIIKYKPKDIIFTYFIEFNGNLYQCEIINLDNNIFTYIHIKTTPLKNNSKDLIYTLEDSTKINYHKNILSPSLNIHKKVLYFYKSNKVFYQNNEVGDSISNYLKICKRGV